MGAAVEHVHHRHRQQGRLAAAVELGEVAVERLPGVGRGGLGRRQRDAEERVGAEPALVRGAVELDHRRGRARPARPRRAPVSAAAISPLTLATACETPLPAQASPPSRSSTASNSPVEAPEGRRPGRGRRTPARLRPRRSGCRASRGSGGRGSRRWCSRVRQSIARPGRLRFAGWAYSPSGGGFGGRLRRQRFGVTLPGTMTGRCGSALPFGSTRHRARQSRDRLDDRGRAFFRQAAFGIGFVATAWRLVGCPEPTKLAQRSISKPEAQKVRDSTCLVIGDEFGEVFLRFLSEGAIDLRFDFGERLDFLRVSFTTSSRT